MFLILTTTVFGISKEVTVAELAIEVFCPADAETASCLFQSQAAVPQGAAPEPGIVA